MFRLLKPKSIGSSLLQVDVLDVKEGILRLADNRYRLVIQTSSINFELKSDEEQDAIIDIYGSFLNSISFPLQILIRTREINIDDYFEKLDAKLEQETEPIYKKQLKNYQQFIESLISDNKILSRQFYVVITFESAKPINFSLAREQLSLRADIVAKNLGRLGIATKELASIEVIDLFYNFYSPVSSKLQPLSQQALNVINAGFVVGEHHEIT